MDEEFYDQKDGKNRCHICGEVFPINFLIFDHEQNCIREKQEKEKLQLTNSYLKEKDFGERE